MDLLNLIVDAIKVSGPGSGRLIPRAIKSPNIFCVLFSMVQFINCLPIFHRDRDISERVDVSI